MKKEMFLKSNLLDEKSIALDVNARTVEMVLHILTELLGPTHVRPGFEKALIEREHEYPTGLPTQPVGVALPHADPKLVVQAGLIIVVLRNPVMFEEMGNPDQKVEVRVVIGIALPEDFIENQTPMLSWLLEKIQQVTWLNEVLAVSSPRDMLRLFR